ncbi:MAG: acetyl-CoA carboxylase biotin carboxyl carrier protein [Phycisphaeraceae bacterium]|nr:acetyl-CoA carboxylase biotin carboxyl carrier protein [Phycisphaeraceae bacterium]MCW5767895.1 acetyl-CoA carboxylase biotin carboxyl carrier protein [Phycisphaeraceae bacterium]
MIDMKKLAELVQLMTDNGLTELELRDENEAVVLKRGQSGVQLPPHLMAPQMMMPMAMPASAPGQAAAGGTSAPSSDAGLVAIESPMVGTFYSASNPDSPPFAKVGSQVGPGSVVCLVEAMKVFNEIKSEVSGTIERVLVKNGDAVEFGQKLFLVKP